MLIQHSLCTRTEVEIPSVSLNVKHVLNLQ